MVATILLATFSLGIFTSPVLAEDRYTRDSYESRYSQNNDNYRDNNSRYDRNYDRNSDKYSRDNYRDYSYRYGDKGTMETTLRYVNGINGQELAQEDKKLIKTERLNVKEIEGYEWDRYDENTDYVYIPKPIPYIVGYPDKTVRPLRYLTRAEAIAIFHRLYDGEYPTATKQTNKETFLDVKTTNWFYNDLKQMYESGLVDGANRKLEPNRPITRAELASLATRFNPEKFDTVDKNTNSKAFSDIGTNNWYSDSVQIAQANGWLSGYKDGTFAPNKNISRTETMAVINRMLERQITAERLRELGVQNPYIDINDKNWAYPDAMEATIRHKTEDWHPLTFNNGEYNVVIEKFVDRDGKEISKPEVSKARDSVTVDRKFAGKNYIGFVKYITHHYMKGNPMPKLVKTSDAREGGIFPNDIITYTLVASNDDKANGRIEEAFISDKIPEGVELVKGSVMLEGKTIKYEYDEKSRELKMPLDLDGRKDIKRGEKFTFTFNVTVNKDSYNKTIQNTGYLKGKNIPDTPASDQGVKINEGKAYLDITKTLDKTKDVKVGDTLVYTINVTNKKDSETDARSVELNDTLTPEFDFLGAVTLDGKPTTDFTFDEKTRNFKMNLGDIPKEVTKSISFKVMLNKTAYGKTLQNIATAHGNNAPPVSAEAPPVLVPLGKADIDVTKKASNYELKVGDNVTFSIVIANKPTSETATVNTKIVDKIPEELKFIGNVLLNGASIPYNFNDKTNELEVYLPDGVEVGKSVVVNFDAQVKDKMYGKEFKNNTTVTSDNTPPRDAETPLIKVEKGKADGNVSVKFVDKTEAKVGETVTYSMKLSNSSHATADWENVKIVDPIPQGMVFKVGSVKMNGQNTQLFDFDSAKNELTFKPNPIKAGEEVTFSFEVTIAEGMEGMIFTNVAVLRDGDKPERPIPANPVKVPSGELEPWIEKSHDGKKHVEGDEFDFTIKVGNKSKTTTWKNVMLRDIMPQELEFIGPAFLDNNEVQIQKSGKLGFNLNLGDIEPKGSKTVTYKVKVKPNTQSLTEDKVLTNTAIAEGDNGRIEAHDLVGLAPNESGLFIEKTADKDKVKEDEMFKYRIEVKNTGNKTPLTNVQVTDTVPADLHIHPNVTLDGEAVEFMQSGNVISLTIPKLEPKEKKVITFDVTVKKNILGTEKERTLTNIADARSGSHYVRTSADVVVENKGNVNEIPPNEGKVVATKTVDETMMDLTKNKRNTYRFKLTNNDTKTWKDVVITDQLNTKYLHLFADSVKINGRPLTYNRDYEYKATQQMTDTLKIPVGDIEPNQTVEVSFDFRMENDVSENGNKYINEASVSSKSHPELPVTAPVVVARNVGVISGQHLGIFVGLGDGSGRWAPTKDIAPLRIKEACAVIFRALTAEQFAQVEAKATRNLPSDIGTAVRATQLAYQLGILNEQQLKNQEDPIDGATIGQLLDACGLPRASGGNYAKSNTPIDRWVFAVNMLNILERPSDGDTSAISGLKTFNDVRKGDMWYNTVTEISNGHNYVLLGVGQQEIWTTLIPTTPRI